MIVLAQRHSKLTPPLPHKLQLEAEIEAQITGWLHPGPKRVGAERPSGHIRKKLSIYADIVTRFINIQTLNITADGNWSRDAQPPQPSR